MVRDFNYIYCTIPMPQRLYTSASVARLRATFWLMVWVFADAVRKNPHHQPIEHCRWQGNMHIALQAHICYDETKEFGAST